jgi:hypothetical protein
MDSDDSETMHGGITRPSSSSFPPLHNNGKVEVEIMRGAKLLLLSAAGYSTAIGITVGRWLLLETGEVLLLLFNKNRSITGTDELHDSFASIEDLEKSYSCVDNQQQPSHPIETAADTNNALLQYMGHTFLSIASSPHLRSATLLIFVLSSTTLLVGIVISLNQFQKIKSRVVSSIENGKDKFYQLVVLPTLDGMDQLVLDDIMQIIVKRGMDMWLGMCGGILLYSLPSIPPVGGMIDKDGTVPTAAAAATKEMRRQIICATDPTLERMIFHPGGIWEMLSPNWRDYLIKTVSPRITMRQEQIDNAQSSTRSSKALVADGSSSENENDDDDASFDSPMVCSVPPSIVSSVPSSSMSARGRGDTLYSDDSVNHVDSREPTNTQILSPERDDLLHQRRTRGVTQAPLPTPPSPPSFPILPEEWQLEKMLHRTSLLTTILFVYHLYRSPNTRKAWGYMAHSLASFGLLSTAVSAGIASSVLRSNPSITDGIVNPMMHMICAAVLGQQRWRVILQGRGGEGTAGGVGGGRREVTAIVPSTIQWIFQQLRNQIQRNKRYYLAVLMMYGMGSVSRRRMRKNVR